MKSIVINEAQEPKTISANSIVTALSAGGEQSWVPEDETQLQTKTATRNGKVKPDSGFYGLSEVDVYVKGTYPSPGDSTPIKPSENEQMENATVFMVSIAGGGELDFVPVITIGNAEQEGVISVVDFSNAKIECIDIRGLQNISGSGSSLASSSFYGANGSTLLNTDRTVKELISGDKKTLTYIYTGRFTSNTTTFWIGAQNGFSYWQVKNVSVSNGDLYCFAITVHTNNAAT